jgi:DNA modification methylase
VVDLEAWGLEIPQFDTVEEQEASEDDYEVPEGGIETDIVIGDLFEIGEHRLLCGDSTDSDAVARLMNGEKADMVFTDPPYGIDWNTDYTRFTGGLIPSENKYNKIHDDEKAFDPSFLLATHENCLFFGANCFSDKLPKGNWIVWDKRFENGKAFLADAEVAWYNGSGAVYIIAETHQGFVSSDKKRFHPTQKPIKVLEKIFEKINAPNLLLDPYLGSGSTMVAAHQLKRRCFGLELEPKYCAVIIDRMRKLDSLLIIKRNGKQI